MNGEKVDLRLKWHCGNLNLVPCEPMLQPQAATSVICLLSSAQSSAVVLVIYLNFWVKALPVQCSWPSDMFEDEVTIWTSWTIFRSNLADLLKQLSNRHRERYGEYSFENSFVWPSSH